jgi:hypothetical protein
VYGIITPLKLKRQREERIGKGSRKVEAKEKNTVDKRDFISWWEEEIVF